MLVDGLTDASRLADWLTCCPKEGFQIIASDRLFNQSLL
jgi:hypothetical protein